MSEAVKIPLTAKKNGRSVSTQELDSVTIRFAGDSGDGMQLTGAQFTSTSLVLGNDVATFPDYPAEIRAPAGSLPGVSGFQIHFSSHDVRTHGDTPNVLVAMNPAALKINLADLEKGGLLIINKDAFNETNLKKAAYETNPLEDGSLSSYRVFDIAITSINAEALRDLALSPKEAARCKNFFALGLMYWLYTRSLDTTQGWIDAKFSKTPEIAEANRRALQAGYNYGETTELFTTTYSVPQAKLPVGHYRQLTGNHAVALALVAAGHLTGKPVFYASYPITPASEILHELSEHKNFGLKTYQAEDEIAAICAAIGAAFGGAVAATGTSGPGLALKSEALGLAVMTELPLVVINVQRAGPSTGLPTKTEQADLLQALYGRNGESPVVVLAPGSPGECFEYTVEAVRIAVKYMCPVVVLTDGYLANGAEPWAIPDVSQMAKIPVSHLAEANNFAPYLRDEKTLARPWVVPGTKGMEHRIGGLEKQDGTGNVSYDPLNHQKMVNLRAEKIARIANELPPTDIFGKSSGKLLVIGWGCTTGAITTAVEELQREGHAVSSIHLRYINPLPNDLGDIMKKFDQVLVAELNMGQLRSVLRAKYILDIKGFNKVQGQPLKIQEMKQAMREYL